MLINVVICQLPIGSGISLTEKIHIFKRRPDFVCLPEYFLMPPGTPSYATFAAHFRTNLQYLARLSNELETTLIGGSIIEKADGAFYNTCYVFRRGEQMASYRKQFPTANEQAKGVCAGKKIITFEVAGARIGLLLCADALHPECFEKYRRFSPDLIFIPTISPLVADDTIAEKCARDRDIYCRGAELSGAYVIKTCGLGTIFNTPLNGRSLVAAPWDLLWRVDQEYEQQPGLYSQILNIAELREFRRAAMIREVVNRIDVPAHKETN